MYYEDIFHPNEENDITTQQKKEINNIKSIDSGYGCVYRKKLLPSGKMKKARVDCYTSGDAGTCIRNAETGNYYKYKVGSMEEDLFFKISLSTGELKTRNSSNLLFYDSPEHYENHLMTSVVQTIKDSWTEKKNALLLSKKK